MQFVIVDLDRSRSAAHKELVKKYFRGSIPHLTILDKAGRPLYDEAGEAERSELAAILDRALN